MEPTDRPLYTFFRELSSALDTVEGGIGFLATLGIGAGILAELLARPGDVQDVIGDLKSKPDVLCVRR